MLQAAQALVMVGQGVSYTEVADRVRVRNAERTNRMLELVRLRLNRADDPTGYATAIRGHLDANGGRLSRQGVVRDPRGQYSLR